MRSEKGYILIVVYVFVFISSLIMGDMMQSVIAQRKMTESFVVKLSCFPVQDEGIKNIK